MEHCSYSSAQFILAVEQGDLLFSRKSVSVHSLELYTKRRIFEHVGMQQTMFEFMAGSQLKSQHGSSGSVRVLVRHGTW